MYKIKASFESPGVKKNDLTSIPFEKLGFAARANPKDTKELTESFAKKFSLSLRHSWIMPQMVARFGSWKNYDYDPRATVKHNTEDDFSRGLYLASMLTRSAIVGETLYKSASYNSLVPLILYGFKLYQNIPYSKWSKDSLDIIVNSELCEAMLFDPKTCYINENQTVADLSKEDWLTIRDKGLIVKSGKLMGQSKSPISTANLFGLSDLEDCDLSEVPKFARIMYAQIWCAHPANRNSNMILDPSDWDNVPEALVDSEVMLETKKINAKDYDWDAI